MSIRRTAEWLDAAGTLQPILNKPAEYSYSVLSPDGKQVAFLQPVGGNRDICVHGLAREVPRRLTFTEGENVYVRTPDGKRFAIVLLDERQVSKQNNEVIF